MKVYVVSTDTDGGHFLVAAKHDWNLAMKVAEELFPNLDMEQLKGSKLLQENNWTWHVSNKDDPFQSVKITQLDLS